MSIEGQGVHKPLLEDDDPEGTRGPELPVGMRSPFNRLSEDVTSDTFPADSQGADGEQRKLTRKMGFTMGRYSMRATPSGQLGGRSLSQYQPSFRPTMLNRLKSGLNSCQSADFGVTAIEGDAVLDLGGSPMAPHSPTACHSPHRVSNAAVRSMRMKAAAAAQKRASTRWHLFQIAFTVIFLLIAASVFASDRMTGDYDQIYYIPVVCWALLLAAIFPVVHISGRVVDSFVWLVELGFQDFDNVHYLLMGLSSALRRLFTAVFLIISVLILIHNRGQHKQRGSILQMLKRLAVCMVILTVVDLIKVLMCRLLSLQVQSASLFTQLHDAIEKESVLSKLMVKLPSDDIKPGAPRAMAICKVRGIPEWAVGLYLNNLYNLSLVMPTKKLSFTDQITRLSTQFQDMSEADLDEHSSNAAEYFWLTVRDDLESLKLFRDDLLPRLRNAELADWTFSLFDLDGDTYVTEPEVHDRFREIYRERRDLATTLNDTNSVISTLQGLVGCVMHTCAFCAYLGIFGVNVGHLLLSLSSIALASAFIFGNSLKTLYESLIFLFVVHPYQVGHAIQYEGKLHRVKGFGLISTQMQSFDCTTIWVPNQKLMASDIVNVTTSGPLQQRIAFEVDAHKAMPELLCDLESRLHQLTTAEDHSHLFDSSFHPFCSIQAVKDPLKFEIGVCYQLVINAEVYARVCDAHTKVNYVLGMWLKDHQLTHSQSIQPGFLMRERASVSGNGSFPTPPAPSDCR